MNVLVACEESQRVAMSFRDKGHYAFSCDVLPCSGGHPEYHIQGDALEILNGGDFVTMDGRKHHADKWDLLIAHPPCTYLPPYTQAIQPYQFGHPYTKKTCLWLKGLPPLESTNVVEPVATWCPSGSYSHKHGGQYKGMFTTDRAKNRAKTFPGVAKAMADQWG